MICAACLTQGRPLVGDPGDPDSRPAGGAITISDGQALCLDHLPELLHVDLDG